ncbi:MAG: TonB-dependent receptor [Saprospiraceae bacterium]|nr:TonB-dependent receptor [Saprospiraceae bacterium]
MQQKILVLIISIFLIFPSIRSFAGSTDDNESKRLTISGHISDKESGEELLGATIYVKELQTGTLTNLYGFFSISLLPGTYTFTFSYIGYQSVEKKIVLDKNITYNVLLSTSAKILKEVEITGRVASENVTKTEMSVVRIDAKAIQKIPALMGEVDIIKAIQLLPGVQSTGEGSSGFSVRGGSRDQNLILLDEATVYNASHLMGFFSVFNNDAVKDVKLYKGDIPATHGGRLSSLLDIRQKDGNSRKFSGTGGIGTVSSRLTIEGPIIKDKCSFIVAGRRSYADVFLRLSKKENLKNNILYFYDFNAKINFKINDNNRIYFSRYMGRDVFKLKSDDNPFGMSWGNAGYTLRWNHLFSEKVFSNFTLIRSHYDYHMGSDAEITGFKWVSDLLDWTFKSDFVYYINPKNTMKFGAIATLHKFEPGNVKGVGDESIFNEIKVPHSRARDYAIYTSNEQKIGSRITANYGLRYSIFQSVGNATSYNFDENYNKIDSTVYAKGEIYNTYSGLEPRIGVNFSINEVSSIKASYSRNMQYVHLASNATVGMPLDVWLPSSPNIEPQIADQYAIGYFRNFKDNSIETSVEVYYKDMQNQIDFKDHAQILLNPRIEGEIRIGEATAYGIELLVRKQVGKLTGWLSYTYCKTERNVPEINNGNTYPSPYDKPHDISIVANYQISKRISISGTWVYATGSPVTFPTGRFRYGNLIAPVYSDRNSYRMPDYHRLDLGVTLDGKDNPERKWHSSWNLSVYNAYNRHNAFQITFEQNEDNPLQTDAIKTYMFPIIPSITYNFHF